MRPVRRGDRANYQSAARLTAGFRMPVRGNSPFPLSCLVVVLVIVIDPFLPFRVQIDYDYEDDNKDDNKDDYGDHEPVAGRA
jgi:hypothetical protein